MTFEELIATLKHSNLDTILVEGKDDVKVYSKIEREIGPRRISFLPCGGKQTLLKVYENKDYINNISLMFIADSDLWVFNGCPLKYKGILFTKGYSIENDLFEDGKSFLFNLMSRKEKERFNNLIINVSNWFAFEIKGLMDKKESEVNNDNYFYSINLMSNKLIKEGEENLSEDFLIERNYDSNDFELKKQIRSDYVFYLKGKFIFELLIKVFQERVQAKTIKYHKDQLFDMCFAKGMMGTHNESNINEIIKNIKKNLIKNE